MASSMETWNRASRNSLDLKNIYMARRNPAFARGQFAERWRRHGQLAMSLPFWRFASGYQHCDVLEEQPRETDPLLAGAWADGYDGIGLVYFPGFDDIEGMTADPAFPTLLADEWGAFVEPVANFSMLTREEVLKDRSGAAVKYFAFLRRSP